MHRKHKYEGEDLKKLEGNFQKIAKAYPLRKRFSATYDLDKELVALDTECKLVRAMYKLNDFKASCYAYSFTMKKIDEIVQYCYEKMSVDGVMEWCNSTSDITIVRQKDGSKKQMSKLGFVYDYLRYQQMAIAARYFIEYNIQYLERDKTEKDYPCRKRILEAAIWWANQGLLGRFGLKMPFTQKEYDITPQVVIFATFPSSGKSYLNNTVNEMFTELEWIVNDMGGVLRVGNEQGNIWRQSAQTKNLIENKFIFDIYPENREFIFNGKYRPFGKYSDEEWGLNGVKYDPSTSIFKTRDSAINSVRCRIAFMDDPSRGQQEATNNKIHEQIVQLYRGDFTDRFKNQDDKFIMLTGTMFNPNDVISLEMTEAMVGARQDKRFKNTYISADNKTIVIINDCEDAYGNSAYPEFISTTALAKKRAGLDPYSYACTWRQKPIPPEGLIFDYDFLMTYDDLPNDNLEKYAVAYVDPTRRSAKDFFAMPICRYNNQNDNYYLVDCIYEQKSAIDLCDKVVEKIVENNIVKIVIEENTDVSLSARINDRLEKRGIKWCKVVTVYNTVKKAQRIGNMEYTVKSAMVFPAKGKFPQKHRIAMMMRHFTQYAVEGNTILSKFDDAPDALCGIAQHFIVGKSKPNTIKSSNRRLF